MRDAFRAVGLVIGVILLLAGGVGLLTGKRGVPEFVGVGLGGAFLVFVAIIPPGTRPPPIYDDDW